MRIDKILVNRKKDNQKRLTFNGPTFVIRVYQIANYILKEGQMRFLIFTNCFENDTLRLNTIKNFFFNKNHEKYLKTLSKFTQVKNISVNQKTNSTIY